MLKKFCFFLPAFFILLFSEAFFATTISGDVYEWNTLNQLDDVIVQINTSPIQRVVSRNGSYLFNVPPGNYTISAKYYEGSELKYSTDENVTVATEGNFNLDLLMTPIVGLEEPILTELDEGLDEELITGKTTATANTNGKEKNPFLDNALFALVLTAILLGAFLFFRKGFSSDAPSKGFQDGKSFGQKFSPREAKDAIVLGQIIQEKSFGAKSNAKEGTEESNDDKQKLQEFGKGQEELMQELHKEEKLAQGLGKEEKLDKYALEVIDTLRRSGNRLTQKELREKVSSVGEAKVSLIVSELEALGKVKKIKQGRGNIIVLKEGR